MVIHTHFLDQIGASTHWLISHVHTGKDLKTKKTKTSNGIINVMPQRQEKKDTQGHNCASCTYGRTLNTNTRYVHSVFRTKADDFMKQR